jgi:hypothetical protein
VIRSEQREMTFLERGRDPLDQYALDGVNLKEFVDAVAFDSISVTNDRELRERFGKV